MEAIEKCLRNLYHSQRISIILIRRETGNWLIFAHVANKNTQVNHGMREIPWVTNIRIENLRLYMFVQARQIS